MFLREIVFMLLGCLALVPSARGAVSVVAAFPAATVVSNADDAAAGLTVFTSLTNNSTGWKGNSFKLTESATVTSVTVQLDNSTPADTSGSLTLKIYRLDGGIDFAENGAAGNGPLPTVASPTVATNADPDVLWQQTEVTTGLPLASAGFLQITLNAPLNLPAGDYGFFLTTDDLDFNLELRSDGAFQAGELLRWNNATPAWEDRANDLVFAIGGVEKSRPPAGTGPNIVFVMADDLGWTDLSTGKASLGFSSDFNQTPNLARLADQSLSFTHAYVHQNCAPTRAALTSGQNPARAGNGVYVVDDLTRATGTTTLTPPLQREDVPAETRTLAEMLWEAGYVTCHVGKYHIGNKEGGTATLPENQGFDFNLGGTGAGHPGSYYASAAGTFNSPNAAMDAYGAPYTLAYIANNLLAVTNGNNPLSLVGSNKHLIDAEADAVIDFIATHRSGSRSNYPFFLQYWSYGVHTPLEPRADLKTKYQSLPAGTRHNNVNYAALVENLDQSVGRILNHLEATGLSANTLVVFLSDNGGPDTSTVNTPLRAFKGTFFDGGMRVPLMVRWPGRVPTNQVTDTLVQAVDFYPTLMEIAGGTNSNMVDGVSFREHMLNPASNQRVRPPICYHYPGYLDDRARPCSVVIKPVGDKVFKLIYSYDIAYDPTPTDNQIMVLSQPWELYNLTDDISEATNLVNNSYWDGLLYGGIADAAAADLGEWLTQSTAGWSPAQVSSNGLTVPFPPSGVPHATPAPGQEFRVTSWQRVSSNQMAITFNSAVGYRFSVEAGSDLASPANWQTLATNIIGLLGSTTLPAVTDPGATNNQRFYRVTLR